MSHRSLKQHLNHNNNNNNNRGQPIGYYLLQDSIIDEEEENDEYDSSSSEEDAVVVDGLIDDDEKAIMMGRAASGASVTDSSSSDHHHTNHRYENMRDESSMASTEPSTTPTTSTTTATSNASENSPSKTTLDDTDPTKSSPENSRVVSSSRRGRAAIIRGTPPALSSSTEPETTAVTSSPSIITPNGHPTEENSSEANDSSKEPTDDKKSTVLDVVNDEEALLKLAQERNKNRKRGNPRAAARHETQSTTPEENDWIKVGYSSKHASTILHTIFLDKLTKYENLLSRFYESADRRDALKEEAKSLTSKLLQHFKEKELQQTLSEEQAIEHFDILSLSPIDAMHLLIRETFLEANEAVCEKNSIDGTTATLVYVPTIDSRFLFVGNVGDSKVVLCRDGKPIVLTVDHRPTDSDERRRVRDAGKSIVNNRISACLAVSRSIGDKTFQPGVISDPHTQAIRLCDKDEFVIVACDGIFDFVSEQEAIDEIRNELDPVAASLKLRDYAYHKKGSNDNITVVVARLKSVLA
ncbi:hypothetical protein C9374_003428 [Naegleria lovaniensis]|uniref:PPM-type phosphatase domain-containing protein n=1 Tax=Naegleria lovaniensis TaxID=51637 RepID=A0AA88KKC3_NAELO|nr:uncharacterized protein C9374_003428 [Naegleria lovaniensis]KAG2385613.1 hypothetical protein C9374_003428 [Naegleria lovaniensis]